MRISLRFIPVVVAFFGNSALFAGGESESARGKNTVGVHGYLVGADGFGLSSGLGLSLNTSPTTTIGLSFLQGSVDLVDEFKDKNKDNSVEVSKANFQGTFVGGYYRRFFTNSFSVFGGLGYRKGKGVVRVEPVDDSSSSFAEAEFVSNSVVVPIGIGNHWAWDNGFTIGFDWISAMIPVSGTSEVTLTTNSTLEFPDDLEKEVDDAADALAKAVSLNLLVLQIGFVF